MMHYFDFFNCLNGFKANRIADCSALKLEQTDLVALAMSSSIPSECQR